MQVWLVAPALGRLETTAFCLPALRWTLDRLGPDGGGVVVVADDDNIDLARELGFVTVTQQPWPLGRKFNDGYQTALAEGADFVVTACSDNWIYPHLLHDLHPEEIQTGHTQAFVDGDRIAVADSRDDPANPYGLGPFVFPRRLLEACGGRPCPDEADYGTDRATVDAILARCPGTRLRPRFIHPYQFVGFKDAGNLTGFDDLSHMFVRERPNPAFELRELYPPELTGLLPRPQEVTHG